MWERRTDLRPQELDPQGLLTPGSFVGRETGADLRPVTASLPVTAAARWEAADLRPATPAASLPASLSLSLAVTESATTL